jgi:hypothetical protein
MLLNSCIKNVAINYLVDGTFSFDQALLQEHISSLTSDGRQLHVVFFLSNGPAQRRWSTTSIEGFGTKISPEEFRFRIQTDSAFQEEYKNIVRRLTPVLETAISGGAQVYLIPALEDNLTVAAFEAMRRLTLEAIPAHLPVSIGRNPSTDYANSDPTIPAGVFVKEHIVDLPMTVENGFVSNDGYDYFSPGTGENPNALVELNHLRIVRKEASALGSIFILWSARAQGLQDLEPLVLDTVFPDPANRDYQIPNKAEQQEIHAFLRENLN